MYQREKVSKLNCVYYYRTSTNCKIIYYNWNGEKWKKNLREISFSPKEIDPVKCVLMFRKIAKSYDELVPFEPNKIFTNGVYTYFSKGYKGYSTALDMNSAYLYALTQPLADYTTRTEVSRMDIAKKEYDYYCFENDLHCEMFYKDDKAMYGTAAWSNCKIYGYKGRRYFVKTCEELYRLKTEVNKEKYKNVANITVGCMHKRSGKQNNSTIAASLYAWFEWYIKNLVKKFESKGYKVISISTDCIKIKGKYNPDDDIVKLGNGLGEFKVEYEGEAEYYSVGHYVEDKIKWKGMPQYLAIGLTRCNFIETPEKEREIYERFAIC